MSESQAFRRPFRWQAAATVPRTHLDTVTADWLFTTGSLTRRVRCACAGRFAVQVIGQAWKRPQVDEWRRLGMRAGMVAWVREVFLQCGDTPWVFARTVIPSSSLTGSRRRLARLGDRPLGKLLFADPAMRREPVELGVLSAGSRLYARATAPLCRPPREIWGRRRVFHMRGKPLLVSEFFLPALTGAGD